jgi:hypothetical protein
MEHKHFQRGNISREESVPQSKWFQKVNVSGEVYFTRGKHSRQHQQYHLRHPRDVIKVG